MERYKVFLGSEIAKSYDEAKNFTLARVDEYTEFNHKELFSTLAPKPLTHKLLGLIWHRL